MSISIHNVNVRIHVYTIRLGYIRKIRPRALDVWSYHTYTPEYLLTLPSRKLNVEKFDTTTYRFPISYFISRVISLRLKKVNVFVHRQRLINVRGRRKRNMLPRLNSRDVAMLENVVVHDITGFYGIPIKRRGIPYDKVPHHVYLSFRSLLKRKKIKDHVQLKYFFPNVAVSPSGKIKYLGSGHLLVLPGKGLRILLNVYVVEDQEKKKEYPLVEVAS